MVTDRETLHHERTQHLIEKTLQFLLLLLVLYLDIVLAKSTATADDQTEAENSSLLKQLTLVPFEKLLTQPNQIVLASQKELPYDDNHITLYSHSRDLVNVLFDGLVPQEWAVLINETTVVPGVDNRGMVGLAMHIPVKELACLALENHAAAAEALFLVLGSELRTIHTAPTSARDSLLAMSKMVESLQEKKDSLDETQLTNHEQQLTLVLHSIATLEKELYTTAQMSTKKVTSIATFLGAFLLEITQHQQNNGTTLPLEKIGQLITDAKNEIRTIQETLEQFKKTTV